MVSSCVETLVAEPLVEGREVLGGDDEVEDVALLADELASQGYRELPKGGEVPPGTFRRDKGSLAFHLRRFAVAGAAIDLARPFLGATHGYQILWIVCGIPILAAIPLVARMMRVEPVGTVEQTVG